MGSRGIYHDGWMASAFGPKIPWRPDLTKLMSWTPDQDVWELYNIDDDFSQADNLAAKEPAKLAAMRELCTIEAAKNNVFPVSGGLYAVLNPWGRSSGWRPLASDACLSSDRVGLLRRPESHRRNPGTQL